MESVNIAGCGVLSGDWPSKRRNGEKWRLRVSTSYPHAEVSRFTRVGGGGENPIFFSKAMSLEKSPEAVLSESS